MKRAGSIRRRLILWIIFGVVMIALSVDLFHRLNSSNKRYANNTHADFLRFAEKIPALCEYMKFVDIDVFEDLTKEEMGRSNEIVDRLLQSIPRGNRGKAVMFSLARGTLPGAIIEPGKWSKRKLEQALSRKGYKKTTRDGMEVYINTPQFDVVLADQRIYSGLPYLVDMISGDNKPEDPIVSKKDFIEVAKYISPSAFEVELRRKTDRLIGILDRATWWLDESCRSSKGLQARTIIMFDTEEDALSALRSDEVMALEERKWIAAQRSPPPNTVFIAEELDRSGKAIIITIRFQERQ